MLAVRGGMLAIAGGMPWSAAGRVPFELGCALVSGGRGAVACLGRQVAPNRGLVPLSRRREAVPHRVSTLELRLSPGGAGLRTRAARGVPVALSNPASPFEAPFVGRLIGVGLLDVVGTRDPRTAESLRGVHGDASSLRVQYSGCAHRLFC